MLLETEIKKALMLDDDTQLQEVGVFVAPPVDLSGLSSSTEQIPPGDEFGISEEWLSEQELQGHFSKAAKITAALPYGRAKYLDVEPRILIFEDIPPPRAALGRVTRMGDSWVLDSRTTPAILELEARDRDVVIWGQDGKLRIYAVRRIH